MIRAFLNNVHNAPPAESGAEDGRAHGPASIFGVQRIPRLDIDQIADLIPSDAAVLDLGCGRGTLLARLRSCGRRKLMGIEIGQEEVLACLRQGFDVIQADLNLGLSAFSDSQFDYVVLSHTLQAVRDVENLIDEMLRVGRRSIVSFPNFAYHKLRAMLYEEGKSPVSSGILRYEWYNTPNIRFLSISDFEEFCRRRGIQVCRRIALNTEEGRVVEEDANRMADMAVFVISR